MVKVAFMALGLLLLALNSVAFIVVMVYVVRCGYYCCCCRRRCCYYFVRWCRTSHVFHRTDLFTFEIKTKIQRFVNLTRFIPLCFILPDSRMTIN